LFVAVVLVPCAAQAQDLVQQQATEQTMMQQQIAQQMQESMVQQQMQTQELQMQQHMATSDPTVPEHLQIGNQQFDGSVTGFRKYLEDVKSADPKLYVQLAPDVARLESRQTTAEAALVGGLVLGLASLVYGIASRDDCTAPPVTDPSFAADSAAWSACNDRNMSKVIRFGLLGVGALVVGGVIAVVSWPGRSDLLDLVSKHNRLSKHPLQLQVGYDPPRRATYTGANVAF
jgi:hypothetical protein